MAKRGRPRKHPLPEELPKQQEPVAVAEPPPEIDISIFDTLEESRKKDVIDEIYRAEKASEIAEWRWKFASERIHRLRDQKTPLNFEDYPFQEDIYRDTAQYLVVYGSSQWGKAAPKDAKVLTPSGWVLMGNIKVGDLVTVPGGGAAVVDGVFPQGEIPIFKIMTDDGRVAEACGEHLWEARIEPGATVVIRTAEIIARMKRGEVVRLPCADSPRLVEIKSVVPIGLKDAQCIHIDHPRHLFVTNDYLLTHNTEFLLCDATASAALGVDLMYILSNDNKRNMFVKRRITPMLRSNPVYAKFISIAQDRHADTDSAMLKMFGSGSMMFVGSNSDKNFSSHDIGKAIIDEHQDCNQTNIRMIDDRMSGSKLRFKIIVGNPREVGTPQNQNLDYCYQTTDRREWYIPCNSCGLEQVLGWETHIVNVERADVEQGSGILGFKPMDEEWSPNSQFDMRAVCQQCKRPIDRLAKGRWKAQNPGNPRHGYRLSNLYNRRKRLVELFNSFSDALHNPILMGQFINNQLGLPYAATGSQITTEMLAAASTGRMCGISPYNFQHVTTPGFWRAF